MSEQAEMQELPLAEWVSKIRKIPRLNCLRRILKQKILKWKQEKKIRIKRQNPCLQMVFSTVRELGQDTMSKPVRIS